LLPVQRLEQRPQERASPVQRRQERLGQQAQSR
jgi:hypothetical protein